MNDSNEKRILLGKKIRHYRELAEMSQEELAQKAGYKSKSSIAKIEAGLARTPAYKLIEIASALGVMVTEFLEGQGSTPAPAPALEAPQYVAVEDEENSGDRLQHILLMLAQMNDKQIKKAESLLSTFFEEN